MNRAPNQTAGFTLLEILVAMALLVIGMTGIISLFTTALDLESRAAERTDIGVAFPDVLSRVKVDVAEQQKSGGARPKSGKAVSNEFVLEGMPRYRCRYTLEQIPGDTDGRGYFANITIVVPGPGGDREYDFGYLPILMPSPNEALLRPGGKK